MNIFEKIEKPGVQDKDNDLCNEFAFYSNNNRLTKTEPFYFSFKNRVRSIYMDTEKANRFIDVYMGLRVPTAKIIEKILTKLDIVWQSQNKSLSIEFDNKTENSQAENYINGYIDQIRNNWKSYVKTSISGYIVIEQKIKNNTIVPVLKFLKESDVLYVELTEDNFISEIVYKTDKKYIAAYVNSNDYQLLNIDTKKVVESIPHKAGITPACVFNPCKAIFSPVMYDFFEYTRAKVELFKKEITDINTDKIIPEEACGSDNITIPAIGGLGKCIGGKLYYNENCGNLAEQPVINSDGEHEYCPNCGKKLHIGAGAVHSYNIQKLSEFNLSPKDLVAYISADVKTTEYLKKRVAEMEYDIISKTTGVIRDNNTQKRNELDVLADFEETTKILELFGLSLQTPINILIKALINIKFPNEKTVNSFYYFGNKWYLLSRGELIDEKTRATNGIERADAINRLLEYDYKHDSEKLNFFKRLYEIYPYSNLTDEQFFVMIEKNLINIYDIELRNNFDYYMNWFRREYQNTPNLLTYDFINEKIKQQVTLTIESKRINISNNIENNGK